MNELENGQRDLSGSYQPYLSKLKILRLLGDLERFTINEKWSEDRSNDHRLQSDARRFSVHNRWLSSRLRDPNDPLANRLAAGLLNANETTGRFSRLKNKKGSLSNKSNDNGGDWGEEENEYFTDVDNYLPSESMTKFAELAFNNQTPETDFLPIPNPSNLIRPPKENKSKR